MPSLPATDVYADHFVDMGEHVEDLEDIAGDFEEPHRTTLLSAIAELTKVIDAVNDATDPRKEDASCP